MLLLLTNQLRKDLSSTNQHEVSLALECLSVISTPDFACDLTPDIFALLTSKSTDNAQTLAATVGVFCELASKEPRSYLPLAYRILVDSRNNWVLINLCLWIQDYKITRLSY
ncbi:hypothetical protein L1887_04917 [Cichorium endivia]|nr:hypothetical protein L1887_04917 [Cichorium endivia]